MIAEALRGAAEGSTIELGHHVLNLNRLDRDALTHIDVEAAAGRRGKCVLGLLKAGRTAPCVGAA